MSLDQEMFQKLYYSLDEHVDTNRLKRWIVEEAIEKRICPECGYLFERENDMCYECWLKDNKETHFIGDDLEDWPDGIPIFKCESCGLKFPDIFRSDEANNMCKGCNKC